MVDILGKNFDPKTFTEDKETLSTFYQNEGHRDFRVLSDSLIVNEDDASLTFKSILKKGQNIFIEILFSMGIKLLKKRN